MNTEGMDRSGRLGKAPNLNRLWADLLVEELMRAGVELFCLAPGSRSGPLVTAVNAHPRARHLMHFDERGTAFAALGWARATGRPACWITTSGTAVANGLPALVEAGADGVPLIALTADRPPELRHTGANQTIDQPNIFGETVRWRFDLPVPTLEIDPAFVLTTVDQAVHRSLHPPGPVHLNAMFREPLAPDPDGSALPDLPARWVGGDRPYTSHHVLARAAADLVAELAERLGGARRGLIVAGRLRSKREADAAIYLAEHLQWPLIPDICSQLRLGREGSCLVTHADLVLCSREFREGHQPDAVLYLGERSASKRLGQFLTGSAADPFAVVRDDPFRFDPGHVVTDRVQADVGGFCDALSAALPPKEASDWIASWRDASAAAEAVSGQELSQMSELSEPGVARTLPVLLPPEHDLVLGSSMPIRDVDTFALPTGARPMVFANRGASGIDGTVATAAGIARGSGRPVTLLLGDLALLHDINSLAMLRDAAQPPVVIVVLNNDGCGIFHFLPIAAHREVFETQFGTPHGMGFEHAAAQFGIGYLRPEQPGDFEDAYRQAAASGRAWIIEVVTDRVANHDLHQRLFSAAAEAVGGRVLAGAASV